MSRIDCLVDWLFPARDVTPSAVVRGLSEPESGPAADNLVSNEDSYVRGAGDLEDRSAPDGVYLGVGPDQNFSMIAGCRPAMALVVDYRRRNLVLHLVHAALMRLSADRVGYLSLLLARTVEVPMGLAKLSGADLARAFSAVPMDRARLRMAIAEVARLLRPLDLVGEDEWPAVATLQAKLAGAGMAYRFLSLPGYPSLGEMIGANDRRGRPGHFLGSEDRYRRVRDLQVAGRLLPVIGDFSAEDGALKRIATWLRAHDRKLSVVYVSDVEFFLLRAGRFEAYAKNLAALPRMDRAVIVRTSTQPIEHRERVDGDSATTIVRDLGTFLHEALAGKIRSAADLFPA